jgi:hypothetical protein
LAVKRLRSSLLKDQHFSAFCKMQSKEKISIKSITVFGAVGLVLYATAAHADPLPLPKPPGPGGSCSHAGCRSGSYCVPSQGAQNAVPKSVSGNCPRGWTASGSYCLKSGSGR